MAHGDLPPAEDGRVLVAVFASPVARDLLHFGRHLGYRTVLLEPEPSAATGRAQGTADAADTVASSVSPDLFGGQADVVVTDHDRPELGDVLAAVLAEQTRWVGVMGSPRHTAPHVAALRERGVAEADVARVHRPIGLNIGSHSPAEIAVATLAGLLADRNGRPGGFAHSPPAEAVRA
ncbi:MAG: XdhC family protein [Actinomycetes bacterium]